jgi:histidyl-tRNA synthetase
MSPRITTRCPSLIAATAPGYVFRNEKPGPGRFRQFMQFDADIVGSGTVAGDAEICMLAADTMDALGLKGQYVVKVNNRKVLDGVMEAIGLGGEENAGRRLTVLRAIDKLDKFGPEGVRLLLGEGRKDESGDFTKGAGLDAKAIDLVLSYVSAQPSIGTGVSGSSDKATVARSFNNEITIDQLKAAFGDNQLCAEGLEELREIAKLAAAAGYEAGRILIDPSIVRGLEYYTGPVYEVELTFPVTNEDGQVVRFGSVAGGGRYDGLVGRFRPEPVPATGFSIGVSRLYSALKAVKSPIVDQKNELPLVVVTTMDRDAQFMPEYQKFVSQLRQAQDEHDKPLCRADLYLGSSGFNAQMKYADRRGAVCAIIQGSSEREAGTVVIKDLILGAELAAAGRDVKDSAEHKERQAQAQFSVPKGELVEGVRTVIARHARA